MPGGRLPIRPGPPPSPPAPIGPPAPARAAPPASTVSGELELEQAPITTNSTITRIGSPLSVLTVGPLLRFIHPEAETERAHDVLGLLGGHHQHPAVDDEADVLVEPAHLE